MSQAHRHGTFSFVFWRRTRPGSSLPDSMSNLPFCCYHRPCCFPSRGAALGSFSTISAFPAMPEPNPQGPLLFGEQCHSLLVDRIEYTCYLGGWRNRWNGEWEEELLRFLLRLGTFYSGEGWLPPSLLPISTYPLEPVYYHLSDKLDS